MYRFSSTKYRILLAVAAIVLGWFARDIYEHRYVSKINTAGGGGTQIRENSPEYKFINPLILAADNTNQNYPEYADLKSSVAKYIEEIPTKSNVKDVSFYFRNMNGAQWTGVNEDALYAPSSMMKVATLMAYLKLAESNPEILAEEAHYTPTSDSGQFYKPKKKLADGNYTIRDLLQQMIIYSDNDAMATLNGLHVNDVLDVYKELELPDPLQDSTDFMSPRSYSRLFRTLYNGTYISKSYSEWALNLLSYTDFDYGLRSGVQNVTVSSKFGELTNLTNNIIIDRELHDCGIVYYPGKPYFICIMTKGQDFDALQKIISDISKITFDFVEKQ